MLNLLRRYIEHRRLSDAFAMAARFLQDHPFAEGRVRLEAIRNDYDLMLGFMQQGYPDAQRPQLYVKLQQRLYALAQDIDLWSLTREKSLYAEANRLADREHLSPEFIRSVLEGFVADAALLSLDNETQQSRRKVLYERHQVFLNRLFCALWTSPQWSEGERRYYEELLLSPTIDQNDVLLLLSAVMLGTMNIFDPNKFLALFHIYRQAADEPVRQRALVGWALVLPQVPLSAFPELETEIRQLTENEEAMHELEVLQKQVFFCLNAERDNRQIQEDIMPTLMKNNNLNVTRFGITEKEDDPMEDILHPDAADKRMEELEESIQKMVEMQKAGSDIYFGGFSQMKNFPFFSKMSNWFCPFYPDHPDLATTSEKLGNERLMQFLHHAGPFCDSDKYSFAIALSQVIDRLPASVREMLGTEEAFGPMVPKEDMQSPDYLRRLYLQDLYRFFKVYSRRGDLKNPFDRSSHADASAHEIKAQNYFFVNSFYFDDPVSTCASLRLQVGWFLMKQQQWDDLDLLRLNYEEEAPMRFDTYLLTAYRKLHHEQYDEAAECFSIALRYQPDDERAMKGWARASLMDEDYQTAADVYARLLERHPDSKSYALNRCICLLKLKVVDEAVNELYRLRYEHPDDKSVQRVLAWGLLWQHKAEAADKEYQTILAHHPSKEDCLNAGYCRWFLGDVAGATSLLRQYADQENGNEALRRELFDDKQLIASYGIPEVEIAIMEDLVLR